MSIGVSAARTHTTCQSSVVHTRSSTHASEGQEHRHTVSLPSPSPPPHTGKLREVDIEAVCDWYGIEHKKQRKAHLDRLREVRSYVKQLGPLDQLLPTRGGPTAAPQRRDAVMHKNLQLLLQTANSVGINTGGSASRCPPNLQSIAVAVEWCKDESLDVTARCIAYSMPDPCSKQCTERVRLVKERIKELKLLERPRLTVPIDRELVDEVRSKLKVSVAEAAAAVSKHGSNMKAALNEVREQLGLQASENDGVAVVSEAEGVSLYLSERSASGYMGVSRNASGKFFEARCAAGDRSGASRLIGTYDDAVSAAVAYAKFRDEQRQQKAEENGGVAGVEEEEEADADEEGMGNDSRSVVEIIEDHGDGGDGGRTQKWLVRFDSGPRGGGASSSSSSLPPDQAWVGAARIPPSLLQEYVFRKRVEFNRMFEPLLTPPSDHPSGVVCLSVESADALKCAQHLQRTWVQGQLPLGLGMKAFGWTTYGKTLSPHDAEQQRLNTLLLTNAMLPAVRKHLPGFTAMERTLTKWLNEYYNTNVELFYAHGLRQGPATLKSTGFDVHQDTEDFDFIEYTVVVKLTPDASHEKPSKMRVVGASGTPHFSYGAQAGACGLFRARLYHASVLPESPREHLKIAYFFRKRV